MKIRGWGGNFDFTLIACVMFRFAAGVGIIFVITNND